MPESDQQATVLLTIDGAVAELVLNRPEKMNAMNAAMVRELMESFRHGRVQRCARVPRSRRRTCLLQRPRPGRRGSAARGRRRHPARRLQPAHGADGWSG